MDDQGSTDKLRATVPSPGDTPGAGVSTGKRILATLLVILVGIGAVAATAFAMALSAWSVGDTRQSSGETVGAVVIVVIIVGGLILLRWIWRDKRA